MSKFIDLTNQRFGFWKIIQKTGKTKSGQTQWLCQCDCGTQKIVTSNSLRTGNSTSCGCNHSPDLLNEKFDNLLVIGTDHSKGRKYWLCKCDCGKEIAVPTYKLKEKIITSCGCKSLCKRYTLISNEHAPVEYHFNTKEELEELPIIKLIMNKKYFHRLSLLSDISVSNLSVHTINKLMSEYHNGYTNEYVGNLINNEVKSLVPWDELKKSNTLFEDLKLSIFVDKWKEMIHSAITPLSEILKPWGGTDTPVNLVNLIVLKLSKSFSKCNSEE